MVDTPTKTAAIVAAFDPQPLSIASHVLDATFVTTNPPDVDQNSALVALCPVPHDRQGMNDLGWHIRDFLAFKTLIASYVNPETQAWLSQTDIKAAIDEDPQTYAFGRDRRDVNGAAGGGGKAGGDGIPIIVEPSAKKLLVKFIAEITNKARMARKGSHPLVILVCGLTSLEQDVFFDGNDDYTDGITSEQIHAAVDDDSLCVTLVTPSLTSAGWQVNPSFNRRPVVKPGPTPIDFMSRQCGALFASSIVEHFLSWESPSMNHYEVDREVKRQESYPGPAKLTKEQDFTRAAFCGKIHSLLAARMSTRYQDHSFSFDAENDDWEKLIGVRKGRKLEKLATLWQQLDKLPLVSTTTPKLYYLGDAFGGNKVSQINHIKHLIKESFNSWKGYYNTSFGKVVRLEMEAFLDKVDEHEDLDCHAMFNILEHRLTLMIMGDLVIKTMHIQPVWNARCRDFDEAKLDKLFTKTERLVMSETFGKIHRNIPITNMPPGRNFNNQSKIQILARRVSQYLAAALTLRYRHIGPRLQAAVGQIMDLLGDIKDHQIKLLSADPDLQALGTAWLDSIELPAARSADHGAAKTPTTVNATRAPLNGNIGNTKGDEGLVHTVPLSAKATPFIPGIKNEVPSPRIKVETLSMTKEPEFPRSGSNGTTSPGVFLPTRNMKSHEPPLPNIQLNSHRDLKDVISEPIATHLPEKTKEGARSILIGTGLENLDVDDEAHLPPHLRPRYRPKTPVRQAETPATKIQPEKTNTTEQVLRNTPPHLRGLKTPASVPNVSYR